MILLRDLLRTKKRPFLEKRRTPIWFMRQAGRYLPEYLDLRSTYPDFLSFCADPKGASKATLQPLKRFDLDAAIIFSDILVIPKALGQNVTFEKGFGPKMPPLETFKDANQLSLKNIHKSLQATPEALSLTKTGLSDTQTLIGFAGAPFTLLCYMLEGQGSKAFEKARRTMIQDPALLEKCLDYVVEATIQYLIAQAKAGADVLKIFDSWAGHCPHFLHKQCLLDPVAKIVRALRKEVPETPLMYFPRGMKGDAVPLTLAVGVDGMALDQFMDPSLILQQCAQNDPLVLQGGLDPLVMHQGGALLKSEVYRYLETFKDHPYIFNMGHGMIPEMPIKHVEETIQHVRNWDAQQSDKILKRENQWKC